MKVTFIPIIIGAFGTVTKRLMKGLEILEMKADWGLSKLLHYWDRAEYWEESWRFEETCCHSDSSERLSANGDGKKLSQSSNDNIHFYKFNRVLFIISHTHTPPLSPLSLSLYIYIYICISLDCLPMVQETEV